MDGMSEHILQLILREVRETHRYVERIEWALRHQRLTVVQFRITQENTMAILGIIPGSTGVFTAAPLNAEGQPVDPSTITAPPVWSSSDPLAVVSANSDGLGASVAVDGSAPQNGSFVLTVSNADGSAATPVTVPYDAKPVDNTVASFGVNQTS